MPAFILLLLLSMSVQAAFAEQDTRRKVDMPPPMQSHMLTNMRDHLAALAEMHRLISQDRWDDAADAVESRLGMSSMGRHGAGHMGRFMPPAMREYGAGMHRAASRLARALQAEDFDQMQTSLADTLEACDGCHSTFRIH